MLRQNQVLMQSMVNRMEPEERPREEERAEKLAAKQAEEAASRPSTDPFGVSGYTLGSSSSAAPVPTQTGSNRRRSTCLPRRSYSMEKWARAA